MFGHDQGDGEPACRSADVHQPGRPPQGGATRVAIHGIQNLRALEAISVDKVPKDAASKENVAEDDFRPPLSTYN